MGKKPSGRFVLRLPSELHQTLKNLAARKAVSLNELCLRAVESYVARMGANQENHTTGQQQWLKVLQDMLGGSVLGVILFGSTARGEDRGSSDIDLLIVVASDLPLTRRLYTLWEEHLSGESYSPHFVHMPEDVTMAGSIWFEAAMDGIVLYAVDRRISLFLSRIRRIVAAGRLRRKVAYGHPYWIKREEEDFDVQ